MAKRSHLIYILTLILGVVLAIPGIVFASLPMRMLRLSYGRAPFWLGYGIVVLALFLGGFESFGFSVLLMALLIGAYSEVEKVASSVFQAGLLAVMTTAGAVLAIVAQQAYKAKTSLVGYVNGLMAEWSTWMAQNLPDAAVEPASLLPNLPWAVLWFLIVSLAVALIWERRLRQSSGISNERPRQFVLSEFRVPDIFVWVAISAALGYFLKHDWAGLRIASFNVIAVLFLLYFFQGLAIVTRFFEVFKISLFWQVFWYILIVLQLAVLVSGLGFVDFWLNIRERLARKMTEINKSF